VLGLVLVLTFVAPLLGRGDGRAPIVDLGLAVLLVSGVAGLDMPRGMRAALGATALVALVVRILPGASALSVSAATLASLALLSVVVLEKAFREGPIDSRRIQGAVAAYLLIGLAFASAFHMVDLLVPEAFASARETGEQARNWIYYSFVTLTTVGYGDIAPVHPVARSLAMLEALTGQLYPAILIGRLVSLHGQDVSGDARR
jgi:hypothetical protein